MRGGAMVHEIWLLLAILGGLNFFGPMGLIYGPMVLVFLGTLVRLFVEEERSGAPPAKA
jgi:predicted PurR-regulated permease PerM